MTLEATGTIWKKKTMYKYCTKAMVTKAIKQGREAVIKCASDKWWFFGACTEKQLNKNGEIFMGGNCSMCVYFADVNYGACPLSKNGSMCYGGECPDSFWEADSRYDKYINNPTSTNFKKFQAKARKLARVIGRLK